MYRSLLPKKTTKRKTVRAKRATRLREKRIRTRVYGGVVASVLLGIVLIGAAWGTHHAFFRVQSVAVQGVEVLSASAIQAAADAVVHDGSFAILNRNAVMLYPKAKIERALRETFPRIDTVAVSVASWESRAIAITVTERATFAAWCDAEAMCYRVDDTGFIFEVYEQPVDTSTLRVTAPIVPQAPALRAVVAPEQFNAFVRVVAELRKFGFVPVAATFDENDVTVRIAEGYDIIVSLSVPAAQTVQYVQVLLEQENVQALRAQLAYIDVRFGERVYYKLRDTVVQ